MSQLPARRGEWEMAQGYPDIQIEDN